MMFPISNLVYSVNYFTCLLKHSLFTVKTTISGLDSGTLTGEARDLGLDSQ